MPDDFWRSLDVVRIGHGIDVDTKICGELKPLEACKQFGEPVWIEDVEDGYISRLRVPLLLRAASTTGGWATILEINGRTGEKKMFLFAAQLHVEGRLATFHNLHSLWRDTKAAHEEFERCEELVRSAASDGPELDLGSFVVAPVRVAKCLPHCACCLSDV